MARGSHIAELFSQPRPTVAEARAHRRSLMGIAIVIALIGAIWCAHVASTKHLNVLGYTLLGFLLPLIGVLVVLSAQPAPPPEESAQ
jgi:hypothetical protein